MNSVWFFYSFLISAKEKYFPALFNLENEAVLQERAVEMEGRVMSSKSALAIHSKKWRNCDRLFYFGREGIRLSVEVGN